MIEIGIVAAFFGGLLSFVSPCVLPLVPPYLCYIAGVSIEELKDGGLTSRTSRRILLSAAAFVLGFTTVFVALGSVASAVGRLLAQYLPQLAVLAGIAIILMGLNFLGVFRLHGGVAQDKLMLGLAGVRHHERDGLPGSY